MRKTHLLLATAVALALGSARARAQTPLGEGDERAIRQSVLFLIDRTNHDPMGTLTEYAQSDRVTSVNSETIVTGWDELVKQTRGQQGGAFVMQTGELDIVGMGPDHALVVAPFTMRYPVNGSPVEVPGSMTLAYERTDAGWKIVHEHYSEGLDEQTRRRLSGAARGGGVTGADLLRLLVLGIGGTSAQLAGALSSMLASQGCTAR